MQIGKVITAMITPFHEDGTIHFELMGKIIDHLLATGTDSIIVNGTTGESPTLSDDEKLSSIKFTVDYVANRAPVIAGTGSNNTQHTIELTKQADSLGVDGVMLVNPYYNKPDQKGLFEHFKAVALETKLPIILYNIPGRTGVNLSPKTTLLLSEINNIIAIKEASGDLEQMAVILREKRKDFAVYSGDDGLTLPLLAIGGSGIISVASHIIGTHIQQMIQAFDAGKHISASELHLAMIPLIKVLFSNPNPVPIKYAMSKFGFDTEYTRLPLTPMSIEEKSVFDNIWNEFLLAKKRKEIF